MHHPGLDLDDERDPWWLLLPGMNWRTIQSDTWPSDSFANSVCAMACTVRLIRDGQPSARRLYVDQNKELREWLDKAREPEDAYLRRLALCLLVDVAPGGDDPRTLLAGLVKPLTEN
jgi:hypothetical protein